eukprot:1602456-Ditylum_brightwellii.AAC.1
MGVATIPIQRCLHTINGRDAGAEKQPKAHNFRTNHQPHHPQQPQQYSPTTSFLRFVESVKSSLVKIKDAPVSM